MGRGLGKEFAGLVVGLAGIAGMLWIRPWLMAIYHTEIGAREIEAALRPVFPDRLAPELVQDPTRLARGLAHLQAALAWDPRHLAARRLLARAYAAQDRPAEAEAVLRPALEAFPGHPMVALELGDVADMRGDAETAVRFYEQGRVGNRGIPLAVNYLKRAEAVQDRNLDLAARFWERALAVDPGNLFAAYQLWRFHRHLGDVTGAEEIAARLRRFGPEAVAVRADLDFRRPRYQAQAMARLVEEGLWTPGALERVVADQVARFAEGLEGLMVEQLLRELAARRPGLLPWDFYLAELAQRRGEWLRAEAGYRAALSEDPSRSNAYLRLGMVQEAQGSPEAAALYREYIRRNPEDLLGLQRWTAACEGKGGPECAEAEEAQRALAERTDDRRIAAELLGLPVEAVALGKNLLPNGGFEDWQGSSPTGWVWSDMSSTPPWSPACFLGLPETLEPWEGRRAARVDGLWAEQGAGQEGARAGYWLRESIPLAPGFYVLSFFYRARLAEGGWVGVWVSERPQVLFAGDQALPDTGGAWRKVVIVAWNGEAGGAVRPLLRLWGAGEAAFDAVALLPLQLDRPLPPEGLPKIAIR